MEYWDLSGLPWNMADEGHRHKLHKWLRLYYATHYLIPSLVDIYTRFPLAEMELKCKDPALVDFYNDVFMDQLNYPEHLMHLGREYWTVGEAFSLAEFNDSLGVWENEQLLNPEDITIENFPLLGSKQLKVVPPEYLKRLVQNKSPIKEYRQLELEFPDLIPYLERNEPFPVSDVLIKQVAFRASPWDDHGTPILLRALRTVIHEEKLLASQDAIAERLYSPLLLAKLGFQDLGDGMPPWIPGPEDLDAFRDEMDIALSSDFRLMVHHFGIDIQNVFGREQMPNLQEDFDWVQGRLMQVFGINPSLLSAGSNSQPYASSALQAEFMNQMLRTFQKYLKDHYLSRALVVAEAQEHYEYDKRGSTRVPVMEDVVVYDDEGNMTIERKHKLLVPELDMAVLDMRDEATERQFLQQLRAMGVPISDQKMMIGVGFKYEDTLDEMQNEMRWKTVAQQKAKLDTFEMLVNQGLPVPPDLAAEIYAMSNITGPQEDGQGAPGMPGAESDGGQVGPGLGANGIMMPPPPGGEINGVPGGGPPVTLPEGPGGGPVPQISNERRKGLNYGQGGKPLPK